MPAIKIINNRDEIQLSKDWIRVSSFKSKDRITDQQGKKVDSDYAGHRYKIIEKYEKKISCFARIGRGFLGVLAVAASLGLALLAKPVRNCFAPPKKKIRFATLIKAEPAKAPAEEIKNTQVQDNKPDLSSLPSNPQTPTEEKKADPIEIKNPDLEPPPPKPQTPTEEKKADPIEIKKPDLSPPPSEPKPKEEPKKSDSISASVMPAPPAGVIKNGYGEYLIYRLDENGVKVSISEDEYKEIFSVIEECRTLKGDQIPLDRHAYLRDQIRNKLKDDKLQVAFIPRTLYELIYLRECIQEDIDEQSVCNAKGLLLDRAWARPSSGIKKLKPEDVEEFKKGGFWQYCIYDDQDYSDKFVQRNEYDDRQAHLVKIASKLNEVALNRFENCQSKNEGFDYTEINKIYETTASFYNELHTENSPLHTRTQFDDRSEPSIAKRFADEEHKIRGHELHPLGISDPKSKQIVEKALELECSAQAVNHLILYRGSNFKKDGLVKEESPITLSYGTGLFSGAIYDGGATAFHYMRNPKLDAHAIVVPLSEQLAEKTPFHVQYVHPLIGMMSYGEYFHSRTKIWTTEKRILGYKGSMVISYGQLDACCKSAQSQEELEKGFEAFKSKAYILATK